MFNPINASENIKDSFIDYISSTFSFSDRTYQTNLRKALKENDVIAKGPYLEIGGSYKSGQSLEQLIAQNLISPWFRKLEKNVSEKEKEIKLLRPLYTHQEAALLKANNGDNLVITTGTGSGKTECFILPIINSLLEEISNNTLNRAVRAIIIYPMNALANDQMARFRKIFDSFPKITFGVYTGNTKHKHQDAKEQYRELFKCDPIPNEILSRDEMQEQPPHILITNYSMLEHMLLRPKDDAIFTGANLRYLVLDEAHIYRGATGIEAAMLMRRLRARISKPGAVQYILTSATLGGRESNEDIRHFARNLCNAPFEDDDIIRSIEVSPSAVDRKEYPPELFKEIYEGERSITDILDDYKVDYALKGDENEKIYELVIRSDIYDKLRHTVKGPMTVDDIASQIGISNDELVHFIFSASKALKEEVSLLKARYHFFIRALEGIYISLTAEKKVRLTPTQNFDAETLSFFEGAICQECGRHAIVGNIKDNTLYQTSYSLVDQDTRAFLVKDINEDEFFSQIEDEEFYQEDALTDEFDYTICAKCGKIEIANTKRLKPLCDHGSSFKINLRKAKRKKNGHFACPACEFGILRRGYLGYEAATGVIGTALYEQLPEHEFVTNSKKTNTEPSSGFFNISQKPKTKKRKSRQFLIFSDSRADAAFFASYMDISFKEFLRRRGLWKACEFFIRQGELRISVKELADRLSRLFGNENSFKELNNESERQTQTCTYQSYLAIINELVSCRRSSGLVQMGRLSFTYAPKNRKLKENWESAIKTIADTDMLGNEKDAKALLNLIMLDAALGGAVDSNSDYPLLDEEREYLFFSHVPKKMVKVKPKGGKSYLYGWSPRRRTGKTKTYYYSNRMTRIMKALNISDEEASNFLDEFWGKILGFQDSKEESLSITDFDVELYDASSSEGLKLYKCQICGRVTGHNCQNQCANVKCNGILVVFKPEETYENNHYVSLYRSDNLKPFYIKEHTAQLSRDLASKYQRFFVEGEIHALSCSTTFEMGVDVGSLETVFLRNVPPTPANYVQRAGRAGRSLNSAAYALTYSKLSSHDFTYFNTPEKMISGQISAPLFQLENEKIIRRHINAIALSSFFKEFPEMYDRNNRSNFLNKGGYELFKEYLHKKPEDLHQLLSDSIPSKQFGIEDWSWT